MKNILKKRPKFRLEARHNILKRSFSIVLVVFFAAISLAGCTSPQDNKQQSKAAFSTQPQKPDDKSNSKNPENTANKSVSGNLKISYIDVGQGDSELIQCSGQNMLIDTGTNASKDNLLSYLKSQSINKIDYLVLTHPHEDHIGGADDVINKFTIGTVYMPKATANTKTFRDVISAMKSKNLTAAQSALGTKFNLGEAGCTILGPINSDKQDLNTYSIVLKVTFGNNNFLFTGDAQASNEEDMINKGFDLSADVLKAGHHGSHTSTTQAFLDKVNPKYAVISCGKDNDYGHPHKETMDKLKAKGIKVYRTDESGTIVCTSDGKSISFSCNAGDYASGKKTSSNSTVSSSSNSSEAPSTSSKQQTQSQAEDRTVYYTPNGKSYHYDRNCETLRRSKVILSGKLSDVIKLGKSDPCDKCVH